MKIILFGIQGSGKSTQGNLLHKTLGVPYLSTGHIFRVLAKEHTPLGRYIKEIMNAGYLIPDDKTLEIVSKYLDRPEYKKGYILDGFPRTINQAQSLRNKVDKVIYLKVSDREALWRLAYRLNDDNREDETLVALRKRIELYHKFTDPVLDFYKKKKLLLEIDGEQSIDKIHKEIIGGLKPLRKGKLSVSEKPQKAIVALVGMPGAGKTEAAAYLKKKGIPFMRFGDLTDEAMKEMGLPATFESEQIAREKLREEYGMAAYAIKAKPKIRKMLEKHDVVGIDGLRSWEEYVLLKKEFEGLLVINVYAEPKIRYERLQKRKERSFPPKKAQQRDWAELERLNMGGPIALADYAVANNSDNIQSLYEKIDTLIARLHLDIP